MNLEKVIAQKRAEAESFRNFNGDKRPYQAVSKINPNRNNTITIVVKNTDTADVKKARIFGGLGTSTKDNNLANGIVVTANGGTHQELIDQFKLSPVTLANMKYIVEQNISQFSHQIDVVRDDALGNYHASPFIPMASASNKDFVAKFIEAPSFYKDITPDTYFEVDVNPEETLTFVFDIVNKVDSSEQLKGRPTLQTADPYKYV